MYRFGNVLLLPGSISYYLKPVEEEYISIILAGGKGTRMGVKDKHKSTFEIGGMPSIVRLIYNFFSTLKIKF